MNDSSSAPVARLPQRLTLDDAVAALGQLEREMASQPGTNALVDASALQAFDSSAVAVLLELRRSLLAQGKILQIQHWPQRLRDLVTLYGVAELLQA
jgi:phospholipid transport system transporter-binding protein